MMRYVLITGGSGQLGTELQNCIWPDGWAPVAFDRAGLNLCDTAAIYATVERGWEGGPWAAVINCGAYTSADKAEDDIATAWAINALAPAALAHACSRTDIPLIALSTDYVFSGEKTGTWQVDDPTRPLNVYGASKLGGELAVRTAHARHAIVRTSWVFGQHGHNFMKNMLRLAVERDRLRVVDDQFGGPTCAADLAQALLHVMTHMVDEPVAPTGTFHFSNAGAVSWAGFASEIFRQSALRGGPVAIVEPIATRDYPTPARRPANSLLSHDSIHQAYGITPRPWQDALGDILDKLIGTVK